MPTIVRKAPTSSSRKRRTKSSARNKGKIKSAPIDLASIVRGLYRRVARQLYVDPSYVSRVARGERRSKKIEDALRRELNKIIDHIHKRPSVARKATLKKS